jgi:hypothetical protein
MAAKKTNAADELSVVEVKEGRIEFCVLGKTPLILNRMSQKAERELLLPRKKTAADKAANLKHNPIEEYRASAYLASGNDVPTRVLIPSTAFKGALRSVAVDIPGAAKAQIGRLTYVPTDYTHVFGVPKLFMSVTRSADMNRTPDIRTRLIVPKWACRLAITYVQPILRDQTVANLLAAAGIMRGVGDWRPEKGAGNYGQFTLVDARDAEFKRIVEEGGTAAQDAAITDPECYDAESAELLSYFTEEATRRGFKVVA